MKWALLIKGRAGGYSLEEEAMLYQMPKATVCFAAIASWLILSAVIGFLLGRANSNQLLPLETSGTILIGY